MMSECEHEALEWRRGEDGRHKLRCKGCGAPGVPPMVTEQATPERPWFSPEGLPYLGGTIGAYAGGGGMLRRRVGSEIVAEASSDGWWGIYADTIDVLAEGQAPTIEAAQEAADRALLAEVFRANGITGTGRADLHRREFTAEQVREILEGAAEPRAGSCGDSPPGGPDTPCAGESSTASRFESSGAALTATQLADLVTGLPLGGGERSAQTEAEDCSDPATTSERLPPAAQDPQPFDLGATVRTASGSGVVKSISGPVALVALGHITCWFPLAELKPHA